MPHRHLASLLLAAICLGCPLLPSAQTVDSPVIVNEVLFNPLPGGADYVELYNRSSNAIPLASLRLAQIAADTVRKTYQIADSGLLAPHDMVVVTTDAAYVTAQYKVRYPAKLLEVKSMPSYNDASGIVAVTDSAKTIIDRFDYNEKMHSRLLRDREGVALERRSSEAPTQEPSNWYSASSTAGYGTPTYANSQSHEFLFLDEQIHIATPLFSPDGDGYNDLLDITYAFEDCSLAANITILDAHGRIVRMLARGILLGCQGVLTWDGTDDNGNRCPRGSYVVVSEVYNENGANQSWRRKISLVRQ